MVEPVSLTLLGLVADKVISALAGEVTKALMSKLRGDPAKKSFQQALGTAIQRYSAGDRLALARPLLDKKGILTDPQVTEELAQMLCFGREPNAELIGDKWKTALAIVPENRDFVEETQLLLGHLEKELRNSDVFRPAFEARDLNAIAIGTKRSVESLISIEKQIERLALMLDSRFGELADAFIRSPDSIRAEIRDFSRLIDEKTYSFVGRQWVFESVEKFINESPRGYFFIVGDPGIGKSALAAQMVKKNGYVHHFNVRAENIATASAFLRSTCAQLIATYALEHKSLPKGVSDDSGFLNRLLQEVTLRLASQQHCVIIVDALDEVDYASTPEGVNPLYLPLILPHGVYFIVTTRDIPTEMMPRVDCESFTLHMHADSSDNLADVTDFVRSWIDRPGIQAYMSSQGLNDKEFVSLIVSKSEGNFMYLRHVLPEIASGAYKDRELAEIPSGLQKYYEEHWWRMRGQDKDAWDRYRLPVMLALTASPKPISVDLISKYAAIQNKLRVVEVLREWSPFLDEVEVEYEGGRQKRYRLYHSSFFNFVSDHEDVNIMKKQMVKIMIEDGI